MSGFANWETYSGAGSLLVGILTFAGLMGLGALVLRPLVHGLPPAWSRLIAAVAGIQLFSLLVQVFGIAGVANRTTLQAAAVGLWGIGGVFAGALIARGRWSLPGFRSWTRQEWIAVLLLVVAIACGLLVALAPSLKRDEVYYHMLVPSRLVQDEALVFYKFPWIAAIYPQMVYQIAAAPLHAIGFVDATNVVSYLYWLLLLWLGFSLAPERYRRAGWTPCWFAAMSVGLYAVVWHPTAGAHALGDVALAAAVLAIALPGSLGGPRPHRTSLIVGLLLATALATKVSLAPVVAALACIRVVQTVRQSGFGEAAGALIALATPFLMFLGPLLLWTYLQSGSPLGPMLAGRFGPSIYPPEAIAVALRTTQAGNAFPVLGAGRSTLAVYSPALWIAMAGGLLWTRVPKSVRIMLAAATALQMLVIWLYLTHEPRFLGGIHYGLAMIFAVAARDEAVRVFSRPKIFAVAVVLIVPWLALQLVHAGRFAPVVLGIEDQREFYERNVPYFEDFLALDSILPDDAAILVVQAAPAISSVYSPRPLAFSRDELPPDAPVFLLAATREPVGDRGGPVRPLYRNDDAALAFDGGILRQIAGGAYPGSLGTTPVRGTVCVLPLADAENASVRVNGCPDFQNERIQDNGWPPIRNR